MDILVFGSPELARWDARPFYPMIRTPRDHTDTYERIVAHEPGGAPGPVHRAVGEAILRYDIFPPRLVHGVLRGRVAIGDTVGVHYVAPRLIRLFFAARVTEVFAGERDGWWTTGFAYRTLIGHPELGEEEFVVETERATGAVRVALRSWSRPGTWLARALRPLVRRLQVHASRAAIAHLSAIAAGAPRG
jgi:Domain of unknown function (DUF1990)